MYRITYTRNDGTPARVVSDHPTLAQAEEAAENYAAGAAASFRGTWERGVGWRVLDAFAYFVGTFRIETPAPPIDDDEGCEGHESLAGQHMGETVYCDGSCQ